MLTFIVMIQCNQATLFYTSSTNADKTNFSSRSYSLGKCRTTIQKQIPQRLQQAIPIIFVLASFNEWPKIC